MWRPECAQRLDLTLFTNFFVATIPPEETAPWSLGAGRHLKTFNARLASQVAYHFISYTGVYGYGLLLGRRL